MTLRDKLRHILHPGSKKNSVTSPTTLGPTSTNTATSKSDPNKPPNARDPGFRKSFNLGESAGNEAVTSPRDIDFNRTETKNTVSNGTDQMYTLDKYDQDYLAVSPRTNITVPEGTGANKSLSAVTPLDDEAKTASGQAVRPNTGGTTPKQEHSQFIDGERKDSGYVEPSPTRDAPTVKNSPTSEHTAVFSPEPTTTSQGTTVSPPPSTDERADTKRASSLLAIPNNATEDGTSSIYSDDSSRPQLQQVDSSAYSLPTADSPVLTPSVVPTATAHQQRYTLLVSDVLPINPEATLFPDQTNTNGGDNNDFLAAVRASFSHGSKVSPTDFTPDEPDSWSQGLIADIGKIEGTSPDPVPRSPSFQNKAVTPMATIPDSSLSADQQAEAFADIVTANVARLKMGNTDQEQKDMPQGIPDVASPEETPNGQTTNSTPSTNRPPLVHDDSVYAVTKEIPGAF
ncbi:hypothetical protein TWF696_004857 [Orbilia brochopaga]|uniref:Uncharacterized protein n=1 Tax=Orbilia brochopaga TaxID=3140254 RepID=A0AAV9V287_9PEZI